MLDFIIPAFNEEKNIENLIREIRSFSEDRIIVVDDASRDKTYEKIPLDNNIIKLRNFINCGKGFSIKKALNYVEADYVCIVDGDIIGITKHIFNYLSLKDKYDCLIFTPDIKKGGFGLFRRYTNYVVYKRTSINAPWCISGVRMIKKDVIMAIKDRLDDRFAFEVSMTIELLKNKYKICNVYADFNHRVTGRDVRGFFHRGIQFYDVLMYNLKLRT